MLNFLIVDDSPAMRSFIRRSLELSGLPIGQCLDAGNGKEALAVLEGNNHVDVILSDINMPQMNGEQFVRCVESDARLKCIPVLIISTDSTEHRMKQMFDLGVKGYVKKPFVPESIREEVERVLGASHV